jgi:hypothetical protein
MGRTGALATLLAPTPSVTPKDGVTNETAHSPADAASPSTGAVGPLLLEHTDNGGVHLRVVEKCQFNTGVGGPVLLQGRENRGVDPCVLA